MREIGRTIIPSTKHVVRSHPSFNHFFIPYRPMQLPTSILPVAITTALIPAVCALSLMTSTVSLSPAFAQTDSTQEAERRQRFNDFFNSPDVQEALSQQQPESSLSDIESVSRLQSLLQNLERSAVVLYPLVLDDRLELILVTPDSLQHHTVPVTQTELNQTILEFRQALSDPRSDPQPTAQQLYQWLIAPIEDDLRSVNAEAILYAPDSVLHYVPLAALHTGEQWLIEQYLINHLTAASFTDFSRNPQQPPRVLAAAHTEGSFEISVGDRSLQLSGVPFAAAEVEAIAELMPNTTVFLNEEFSLENVLPQISDHTIVHLAANLWLFPDSLQESFILFGNGDRLSLSEIRDWSMPNVDLVVVSACETGVGDELGDGQELLSLSYLLQNAGVGAVIAPLWQVDDFGTKELMVAFYQALSQGSSYAEALRQAQLALIKTEPIPQLRQLKGTIEIVPGVVHGNARSELSHPYYWAPFTLTGNGL